MQAISYSAFGGSDTLEITERPDPSPQPGEVLVRIEYAGVNPLDWKIREGFMKAVMPYEFPIIPGCDMAGTVVATGPDTSRFAIGDRVFAYAKGAVIHSGTYAEYIAVPEAVLAAVPASIEMAAAASVPVAALTAWQSFHDFAQLRAGETVLITAGAGGVGSLAIQLARHAGATVIATASAANHAYLRELGAQHCIDYRSVSVPDAVRAIAPGGCDVVLDCAGGDAYGQAVESLASGGRVATIVGPPDMEAAQRGAYRAEFIHSQPNGAQLESIAALISAGVVKTPHLSVRPVREAAAAQDDSRGGHTRGKIVLAIDF
ncbi:MAG: NADPH2:quinone reductase [Halieaceae bacterium]|jgi:NADPH2:quinone reductase